MKILITVFDLFDNKGGGETYYRKLIEENKEHTFYFLSTSKRNKKIPANVKSISYVYKVEKTVASSIRQVFYDAFIKAENIAFSVRNCIFDIVEVPDYLQIGYFLKPALDCYDVRYGKLVLGMHGNISTTEAFGGLYGTDKKSEHYLKILKMLEFLQYEIVDIRYGISHVYIEEWKKHSNKTIQYYNYLRQAIDTSLIKHTYNKKPDLVYIGRLETRKGPDIFIELVSRIPKSLYSSIKIIGGEKTFSSILIKKMAENRNLNVEFLPFVNKNELIEIIENSFVFLPSRYDTLNLTALEVLFSGVPIAVGSGAGVCSVLENELSLPFVKVDIDNIYSCIPGVVKILNNYSNYCNNLKTILIDNKISYSNSKISEVYNTESENNLLLVEKSKVSYSKMNTYLNSKKKNITSIKIQNKIKNPIFYRI